MDVVWNVASMLVGALVTWAVSRHYYRRAAGELRDDLESLVKQVEETEDALKTWIVTMT